MKLVVTCPAKINTYLAVGPRDAKGYHSLETIFQAIGLADTLTIEPAHENRITSDWEHLPDDNTLAKTLRLLKEVVDLPPLDIHLTKSIPAQSGLGGGSSDAAGLIRAASRMVGGGIAASELTAVASAVGADVPFFLVGGRAHGAGYGERLTPLPDSPSQWLVIAMPKDVACSTPEMFAVLDAQKERGLQAAFGPGTSVPGGIDEPTNLIHNDFLEVAPEACRQLIQLLNCKGGRAGLTGSGAAVFAFFPTERTAQMAAEHVSGDTGAKAWVTTMLTRKESLVIAKV